MIIPKQLEFNALFLGDREFLLEEVKTALESKHLFEYSTLNIFEISKLQISVEDIRRAISFALKTSETEKIIFLSSFFWSAEVQNALLKILEEPPANTKIYLFGLFEKHFLPTVLSRLQKFSILKANRFLSEAKKVLELPTTERLDNKIVKKILALKVSDMNFDKNIESEKKDRESHILFLLALIEVILEYKNKHNNDFESRWLLSSGIDKSFLEKIRDISKYMDIEGSSPHLFIDWLLLSVGEINL